MAINEETAQPSISAADSQPTLQDLERIIERGKTTFLEVANALHAIKSRDLFKETHPTWEAYVKERWGFSRQHVHRLIQAKKVAEMSPAGDKPKTEREARGRLKSAPRKESSKSNAASSLREIAERFERDLSHWETFLPDVYLTRLLRVGAKVSRLSGGPSARRCPDETF